MRTEPLMKKTLKLLKKRGGYRDIARATGLGYDWLLKLSAGEIGDPGVNRIERLHNFLISEDKKPARESVK